MSPKHILLVPALALLMYLGMYSWNQRTHILDNFAANTGLEASGVVLKSVRMVQDTVMGAWRWVIGGAARAAPSCTAAGWRPPRCQRPGNGR